MSRVSRGVMTLNDEITSVGELAKDMSNRIQLRELDQSKNYNFVNTQESPGIDYAVSTNEAPISHLQNVRRFSHPYIGGFVSDKTIAQYEGGKIKWHH